MTDYSESNEKKEPPKIKLGIPETETGSAAPKATESEPEQPAPEKPADVSQDKPPIKLLLDALADVKIQTPKAPAAEQPEEKKTEPVPPAQPEAEKKEEPPAQPAPTPEEKKPLIKLSAPTPEEPEFEEAPKEEPKAEMQKEEPAPTPTPIKLTGTTPDKPADGEEPPAEPKAEAPMESPAPPPKAKPPQQANGNGPKSDEVAEAGTGDPSKDKTIRLDNIEEESLEDLYQSALNATQRVILDEQQKKKETGPQKAADETQALKHAEMAEATKKSTARLNLQEMLSDEDQKELLKQQTMHISADESPPAKPSSTIKIQKPDDAEQKSSATISIPTDFDGIGKSETARVDLPRKVTSTKPPTQRKTIRIKRPDAGGPGATRPALAVARPATRTSKLSEANKAAAGTLKLDSEESAHPAFAAVAVIAVLVGLVLVYVLAATLSPGIPFPGRLV